MIYFYIFIGLILGVVAVFLILYQRKTSKLSNKKISDKELDFPPKPKWEPSVPVDIKRTVEAFSYYTDKSKTFVVFKNGTCVMVDAEKLDYENEAKRILNEVYNYHPDFNPVTMDDGNYVVQYSQPAYSVVFKDEVEKNYTYINENYLDGLTKGEVIFNSSGRPNEFDDIGKMGLFGRARMFMDAKDPTVSCVVKV